MKSTIASVNAVSLCLFITTAQISEAQTDEKGYWYLKPTLGYSQLSDTSATATAVSLSDGPAEIQTDGGFSAGAILGYQYSKRWASEIGWEYRSNDSQVNLSDNRLFPDGNYASNSFFVNGIYSFETSGKWKPYAGLGMVWIQEVDIDLEGLGPELSFSGDGEIGIHGLLGVGYRLSQQWSFTGELRVSRFDEMQLVGEGNLGSFKGLDYNPTSFQLGLRYDF